MYIGSPPVPSGGYAGLVLELYGKESEDSAYGNAEYAGVIHGNKFAVFHTALDKEYSAKYLYTLWKKAQKKQKFLDSPSLIIVRGGAVNGGVYVPFILTMFPNQFSSLIDLNYIQYIINKINFFISGCSI